MIWPPHIVNISSVIEWWNIKHIFKPAPVAARCLRTPASLKLNEVRQEQPWLGRLWCVVLEKQHTLDVGPDMTVLRGLHKAVILAKPLKALVVPCIADPSYLKFTDCYSPYGESDREMAALSHGSRVRPSFSTWTPVGINWKTC